MYVGVTKLKHESYQLELDVQFQIWPYHILVINPTSNECCFWLETGYTLFEEFVIKLLHLLFQTQGSRVWSFPTYQ